MLFVVKSWRDSWDEVPECPLKIVAYEALKAFTKTLGDGFAKAFMEGCTKGLANQEQEQEQEQKPKKPCVAIASGSVDPRHAPVRQLIQESHLRKFGVTCPWDGSEGRALDRLLSANPSWTQDQLLEMVVNRFTSESIAPDRPRKWLPDLGAYAAGAKDRYNKLKIETKGGGYHDGNGNRAERRQAGNIAAAEEAVAIACILGSR